MNALILIAILVVIVLLALTIFVVGSRLSITLRYLHEVSDRVSAQSDACVDFVAQLSKITNDVLNNKR